MFYFKAFFIATVWQRGSCRSRHFNFQIECDGFRCWTDEEVVTDDELVPNTCLSFPWIRFSCTFKKLHYIFQIQFKRCFPHLDSLLTGRLEGAVGALESKGHCLGFHPTTFWTEQKHIAWTWEVIKGLSNMALKVFFFIIYYCQRYGNITKAKKVRSKNKKGFSSSFFERWQLQKSFNWKSHLFFSSSLCWAACRRLCSGSNVKKLHLKWKHQITSVFFFIIR